MSDLRGTVWDLANKAEYLPPEDLDEMEFDRLDSGEIIAAMALPDLHLARAHTVTASGLFRSVKDWEHQLMRDRLEEADATGVRLGETWYRIERPGRWTVIDMDSLAEWLRAGADTHDEGLGTSISAIFPANSARVTGLRATAERWGHDPGATVGTFMDKVPYRDESQLSAVPLNKAPAFAQRLEQGQYWPTIKEGDK